MTKDQVTADWTQDDEDASKWRIEANDGTESYVAHYDSEESARAAWAERERLFLEFYDTGEMEAGESFEVSFEFARPGQEYGYGGNERASTIAKAGGKGFDPGWDSSPAAAAVYSNT